MSDLSPLLGEERMSNFGAVRSVVDPKRASLVNHCQDGRCSRRQFEAA